MLYLIETHGIYLDSNRCISGQPIKLAIEKYRILATNFDFD